MTGRNLRALVGLSWREVIRFLRQPSRLIGALLQPVLFWVLFGTGLESSFRGSGNETFPAYFLPGTAVMILLFTAIFSTVTVIEDRREGFLQGVLVAPIPRWVIVGSKLIGGTILAVGQTLLFLAIAAVIGGLGFSARVPTGLTWSNTPIVCAYLTLLGLSLTALGYLLAWSLESTQGFHAVMSLVLLPMWLLSGAFFPAPPAGWLQVIMGLNPLSYGVAGLRHLLATDPATVTHLPSATVCWSVTLLFGAICTAVATWLTSRPQVRNVG